MRRNFERWLDKDFVSLSAEAPADLGPADGMQSLLERFAAELEAVGLSLDDTLRTRLWARDAAGRAAASQVRVQTLSGQRRSASSSFICPEHFASDAAVALDLLALRPAGDQREAKLLREYEPPIAPLRYLVWNGLVVLSGVTSERDALDAQLQQILPAITESLAQAGSGWQHVINVDCFVHRSVAPDLVRQALPAGLPRLTCSLVDGYSHPAKLCEIEVTALGA
jgi:enamine deaminase RidA (YjgF/YER057c/UK114 family)